MKVSPTSIADVLLIEPDVRRDARGFFLESYHSDRYEAAGVRGVFVQDNHSRSVQATLRGLHAQLKRPQAKLVRVVQGEVFDVAVDARPGSPTFGRWTAQNLSGDNFHQLYIPEGFLHGFCVLSPFAEVEYKCTEHFDAADEVGVAWNDPALGINWPIPKPILSEKDKELPLFAELKSKFDHYRPK